MKTWPERLREIESLLEYAKKMLTFESRLKSFGDSWEFGHEHTRLMAAAGWFYYPKSDNAKEAYCFASLKLVEFEDGDDPKEEQEKRMKGHPYFERKWAPGLEKLKLTLDELTLGDSIKMRQAQWEAHERYRLDAYYQALEEHVNQLKEEAEIKLSQAGLETTSLESAVEAEANERKVRKQLAEWEKELSYVKGENTRRMKKKNFFLGPQSELYFKNRDVAAGQAMKYILEQANKPALLKKKGTRASVAIHDNNMTQNLPPSAKKSSSVY